MTQEPFEPARTVIVAANQDILRQLLRGMLEEQGYSARECATNEDVVSVLRTDSSACLLMIEPGLEDPEEERGVETVRVLRAFEGKENFPVLFLCGRSPEIPSFYQEFRGTKTSLLSMPFSRGELAAFLKHALGR